MATENILIKWPIHSSKKPLNPHKTAEKKTTDNFPHHTPKSTPLKQGKYTLNLLLGNNPHPKPDGSTTPIEKIPLKSQKTIIYIKSQKNHHQSKGKTT